MRSNDVYTIPTCVEMAPSMQLLALCRPHKGMRRALEHLRNFLIYPECLLDSLENGREPNDHDPFWWHLFYLVLSIKPVCKLQRVHPGKNIIAMLPIEMKPCVLIHDLWTATLEPETHALPC